MLYTETGIRLISAAVIELAGMETKQ